MYRVRRREETEGVAWGPTSATKSSSIAALAFAADRLSLTSRAMAAPQATSLACLTGECVWMSASIIPLAARLSPANPGEVGFLRCHVESSRHRRRLTRNGSGFWNGRQMLQAVIRSAAPK
jgi:hypothetical protein